MCVCVFVCLFVVFCVVLCCLLACLFVCTVLIESKPVASSRALECRLCGVRFLSLGFHRDRC